MNILWDFRLYSYGYGRRGVGVFTRRMAEAILAEGIDGRLFIWGEKNRVPLSFAKQPVHWIDYVPRSWKSDLFTVPLLIRRNRIDIFHYWIGLGPLYSIGMGLFHGCKTCVTVHDLGVEYWNEIEHCRALRASMYWRFQKSIFSRVGSVVCNSRATETELRRCFRRLLPPVSVVYVPLENTEARSSAAVKKQFIAFAGAANKNVSGVLEAFSVFKKNNPDFKLCLVGDVETGKERALSTPGVMFEPASMLDRLLENSSGLIACSIHEGLGLPVLSAMSHGCPLVVSDIPVFHETCGGAARFVDPLNPLSIAAGMEDIGRNREAWAARSREGAARYRGLSKNTGAAWLRVYKELL